jgi:predicted helicase
MKLDDATKIIGCYKALSKQGLKGELLNDPQPMKRALAFCKDIATSKMIQQEFAAVIEEYLASDEGKEAEGEAQPIECQLEHVDGTFNAKSRDRLLNWLKDEYGDSACRILTNARCLSEGVDVPALDAILFMHPRRSQIDVVQSVGRVMRRAKGKNMGYVILPIGVPAGVAPEDALNDNDRYRVVWQILNALRSHDERFDAMINKADLGVDVSDHIEVIAVSNKLLTRKENNSNGPNIGHGRGPDDDDDRNSGTGKPASTFQGRFGFDEFSKAIMAKIVKKCGRRDYWEDWASDIAKIAQTHITRISGLVHKHNTPEREAFEAFLAEIKDDLNDSISEPEAIEMLAQHIITRPVFEALFEGYSFTKNNPVSRAMEQVLTKLDEHNLEKESDSLQKFYESVKRRAAGIDNVKAKQKIIVELYDKFFRYAFPKMTERLGIVYTPVEVVDFIINSVNEVLQSEFGQTLGSKGVHILDPFTGTGTFITRLLQSGHIKREELEHKYRHEIHANEIVLLAYYIAAINIEAAYHGISRGEYVPFEGICLTDTFQLYEQKCDLLSQLLADNSTRRSRQKDLDIRVIIGNPPYSTGQSSANDDAANIVYENLDQKIRDTYAARSTVTNKRPLYDSYVRSMRWASDRIGTHGVVGFVSGSGFLDKPAMAGMRMCLEEDFTSIHVINLRGDIRRNMLSKGRAKEGQNIFASGSMTGISITLLIKNKDRVSDGCKIHYYDIGDDQSTKQKLAKLKELRSTTAMKDKCLLNVVELNAHGDWLGKRDQLFEKLLPMGAKKKPTETPIFSVYSSGVKTNRDSWCYQSSQLALQDNISRSIAYYNNVELKNVHKGGEEGFKWCQKTLKDKEEGKHYSFDHKQIRLAHYRPFLRQWIYFDSRLNWSKYLTDRFSPADEGSNRIIALPGVGARSGFSVFMTSVLPDVQLMDNGQCFPRYSYLLNISGNESHKQENLLGNSGSEKLTRKDAITDSGLLHFQISYPGESITKDDLFYYIYGLLHSEDYRSRYADNLSKELPRIPAVKQAADFWAFVAAGCRLGDLHCDYETVEPYPVVFSRGDTSLAAPADPVSFYRVEKMKFAGKRPNLDMTTVIYNGNITITGIPLEAYEYVVNGKPALEWVMERQCVKTDKASGIVNDANCYAIETAGDPAYPLRLFQRVITVSLETIQIVKALPPLGELT